MTRIVIDTNVYISALQFGGVPRQVVDLVLNGECKGFVSAAIRDETFRILVTKFKWSELAYRDTLLCNHCTRAGSSHYPRPRPGVSVVALRSPLK